MLLQDLRCESDRDKYGEYYDNGYWEGGAWCGVEGKAGYWVYSYPSWYVWAEEVLEPLNHKQIPTVDALHGTWVDRDDPSSVRQFIGATEIYWLGSEGYEYDFRVFNNCPDNGGTENPYGRYFAWEPSLQDCWILIDVTNDDLILEYWLSGDQFIFSRDYEFMGNLDHHDESHIPEDVAPFKSIQGSWESVDDPNYILDFDGTTIIDWYGSDREEHEFGLYDMCPEDGGLEDHWGWYYAYKSEPDMCWRIIELTSDTLSISMVGGPGRTLIFNKMAPNENKDSWGALSYSREFHEFGAVVGISSEELAGQLSVANCVKTVMNSYKGEVAQDCNLVIHFSECGAFASSYEGAWGYGHASGLDDAAQTASDYCIESGGKNCLVQFAACNDGGGTSSSTSSGSNSCEYANDGICDEALNHCPLGTDAADCRDFSGPPAKGKYDTITVTNKCEGDEVKVAFYFLDAGSGIWKTVYWLRIGYGESTPPLYTRNQYWYYYAESLKDGGAWYGNIDENFEELRIGDNVYKMGQQSTGEDWGEFNTNLTCG